MSPCVFCEIVAGTSPATILGEWPDAIALIPLNPVSPRHFLVIPRLHVADATTDPEVTLATMRRAVELASWFDASNILTSVGAAATQSIFHLHFHVVGRIVDDRLMMPWGTTGDPHAPHWCEVAEELQKRIRDSVTECRDGDKSTKH